MNQFHIRRSRHQKFLLCLAVKIYSWRRAAECPVQPENGIVIVCVSDTHNTTPALPPGDLLLHAGDLTEKGSLAELQAQLTWLDAQPHTYKVVIAGNHDLLLDAAVEKGAGESPAELDWGSIIYLQDRPVTLDFPTGHVLTVYGAPWTPRFGKWAFQHPPKSDVWTDAVPAHVDILLTHGPPQCHLDRNTYGARLGCPHLLRELYRARPRLVVFGHVHEGYGRETEAFDRPQEVWEGLLLAKAGWLALCRLVWLIVWQRAGAVMPMRAARKTQATHLVNAAAVGGHGNKERRAPVIVTL